MLTHEITTNIFKPLDRRKLYKTIVKLKKNKSIAKVQSFDWRMLIEIKKACPWIKTVHLFPDIFDDPEAVEPQSTFARKYIDQYFNTYQYWSNKPYWLAGYAPIRYNHPSLGYKGSVEQAVQACGGDECKIITQDFPRKPYSKLADDMILHAMRDVISGNMTENEFKALYNQHKNNIKKITQKLGLIILKKHIYPANFIKNLYYNYTLYSLAIGLLKWADEQGKIKQKSQLIRLAELKFKHHIISLPDIYFMHYLVDTKKSSIAIKKLTELLYKINNELLFKEKVSHTEIMRNIIDQANNIANINQIHIKEFKYYHTNKKIMDKVSALFLILKNFNNYQKARTFQLHSKSKKSTSEIIKSEFDKIFEHTEKNLIRTPVDEQYREFIKDKSVAIVGPFDSEISHGEEIDSFDVVIRTNFFNQNFLEFKDVFGTKTNIALYDIPTSIIKIGEFKNLSKTIDFIIYDSFNIKSNDFYQSRVLTRPNKFFLNGYLTKLPRLIFDTILQKPKKIKIFNASLYLKNNQGNFFSNYYYNSPTPDYFLYTICLAHDLVSIFEFFKYSHFFKEVELDVLLKNIIDFSSNEYLTLLEKQYYNNDFITK